MANEEEVMMIIILEELAKQNNFEETFFNCYNKISDYIIRRNDYIVFDCDRIFDTIIDLNPRALLFSRYYKCMKQENEEKEKYRSNQKYLKAISDVSKDMIELLNNNNSFEDILDYYVISKYPYEDIIKPSLKIVSMYCKNSKTIKYEETFEEYVLNNYSKKEENILKNKKHKTFKFKK